jgi:uncharacterized lipoprotein YmbA
MTKASIRFAAAIVVLLAGCASSQPTLVALPAAPAAATAEPASAQPQATILLRRVTVPGYLDGFPVVTGRSGQQLTLAANEEWAERLSDAAARVLRAALSQRLGAGSVLIEGDGRIPDADLSVEFLALEPDGQGSLALDARWSFVAAAAGRSSHSGRTQLRVPVQGSGAAAVAAATAQALGEFAATLAREAAAIAPAGRDRPPARARKPNGEVS